jgi:hypothetical protein
VALAQAGTTLARTGVYFESYSFGNGLAFKRISELTIPVSVTQRFGDRVVLDVATAFASASSDQPGGGRIDHSGFIDTDARAMVNAARAVAAQFCRDDSHRRNDGSQHHHPAVRRDGHRPLRVHDTEFGTGAGSRAASHPRSRSVRTGRAARRRVIAMARAMSR